MADASKQLALVQYRDKTGATETYATDRALCREQGGTGVAVTTMASLRTELGAASDADLTTLEGDVATLDAAAEKLANKNQTNGYPGLSSGLIAASQLPAFAGALPAQDGVKGAVPAPADDDTGSARYERMRALRGDGGWESRLGLDQLLSVDGVAPILKIEHANTPFSTDSFGYIRSAAAGTQRFRWGVGSTTDAQVDFNCETLARGRLAENGDPVRRTLRGSQRIKANVFSTNFSYEGFDPATITIDTPGAAAVSLDDANGVYVQLATGAVSGNVAGIQSTVTSAKRQLGPDLIFWYRSAHLTARFWQGLFSADPASLTPTSNTLSDNAISGFGLWYDDNVHADSLWRLITSSGSAQTETVTAIPVSANTRVCIRVRHLTGSTFEASNFNFSTGVWEHIVTNTTNAPGATAALKLYQRLTALSASNKTCGIGFIDMSYAV